MFNLSDRDTKLIMLLLIFAVIALPYVFYTRDTRADTEIQKAKNIQLQERYNQLLEMDKKRDFYLQETERLDKARDLVIETFPADIKSENYTMFIRNMEYNSVMNALDRMLEIEEDEELQRPGMRGIDGNSTIYVDSIGYGANDTIPISEEGAENMLTGIVNTSAMTYFCYYDGMKFLLKYLNGYYVTEEGEEVYIPDRMPAIYKAIDMTFDPETGVVDGAITYEQYAIAGSGRELEPVDIWPTLEELEMRGNEVEGIFGPLEQSVLFGRMNTEIAEDKILEQQTGELPVVENPDETTER